MKRFSLFVAGVLLVATAVTAVAGHVVTTDPLGEGNTMPRLTRRPLHPPASPVSAELSRAVADTVFLLGGPDQLSGKFQSMMSWPGGTPDPQGWFGVDRTQSASYWHVSTFNAESFGGTADPNHAIWSGVEAGTSGYSAAPGYGNNWDDILVYESTVNGAVTNTAQLRFQFHYDTEAGWDFFFVDYDSVGTWANLGTYTGISDTTGTFLSPALFDETITIMPGMGGSEGNRVRFRLRFLSDGAVSDEDGGIDTQGAVQVDNIEVRVNGALVSLADFEGSPGDADWNTAQNAFAGDFAKLFVRFDEPDPCRSDVTPLWGFIDDGTPPSNAPTVSTGGALSSNWDYGVPGGWVVNYTGGISAGQTMLHDEIWSPEILWDLPGTDDDAAQGGAVLRFSVYEHLPIGNCITIFTWAVRSYPDENGGWSPWLDRNGWYYEPLPVWANFPWDVSDLLVPNPEKVQIALGAWNLNEYYPGLGGDATPAPLFDNVSFLRYRVTGPSIQSDFLDHFNDSFPQSSATYASATDPLDMAIRLDAAGDLVRTQGTNIVAGDSMVITATAVVPGTELAGPPEMVWVLDANPLFDGARSLPAGATLVGTFTGPDGRTWNRWTGTEIGAESTTGTGLPIEDTFWFDLPDGRARRGVAEPDEPGMFYPADELRFYFRATDTASNVSTYPDDFAEADFLDGTWDQGGRLFEIRPFEVHGLPSYVDRDGDGNVTHPKILYINDFGHRFAEDQFLQAFHQNGMFESVDWDCYTVRRPDAEQSNGIGSAGSHGATADQLSGYDTIVYDAGDLASLSDGSVGENKSNDVQVLTQWKNTPGNRYSVYFGDYVASTLADAGTDALTFMSSVMGVEFTRTAIRDDVGGQTRPVAAPTGEVPGAFSTGFVADGGCLAINEFDYITPRAAAVRSHEFLSLQGEAGQYAPAAGVWYDRNPGDGRKVDVTFPFGFRFLWNPPEHDPDPKSVPADLFAELFAAFGKVIDDSDATGSDTPTLPSRLLGSHPNPFNPKTEIDLRMGVPGRFTLRIYDVRGELVRTLLNEDTEPGVRSITWDGTDHQGRLVGSGVYLTKFTGPDVNDAGKVLLIK